MASSPSPRTPGRTGRVRWQLWLHLPGRDPHLLGSLTARTRRAAALAALRRYPFAPLRWVTVQGPADRGSEAAPLPLVAALRRGGGNPANQRAAQAARVACHATAKAAETRRLRRTGQLPLSPCWRLPSGPPPETHTAPARGLEPCVGTEDAGSQSALTNLPV
jgi:hypothetical protein